jgi:hypothetical protein
MSEHSERLRRISDYSHHLERAADERRLASEAWCVAARAAHLALADLHEVAARERAEDWRPAPYQRERTPWAPLRPRRGETLLESF